MRGIEPDLPSGYFTNKKEKQGWLKTLILVQCERRESTLHTNSLDDLCPSANYYLSLHIKAKSVTVGADTAVFVRLLLEHSYNYIAHAEIWQYSSSVSVTSSVLWRDYFGTVISCIIQMKTFKRNILAYVLLTRFLPPIIFSVTNGTHQYTCFNNCRIKLCKKLLECDISAWRLY